MLLVVFAFSMTYFCRELENVKVFIIYKLTALNSYRRLRRYERGWKNFYTKGLESKEENKQTKSKQKKKTVSFKERLAKKKLYANVTSPNNN